MHDEKIETGESAENEVLHECEQKLAQLEERHAYLRADFDNYRRRADREKIRSAWEVRARILRDVIDLVDNIERAGSALRAQPGAGKIDGAESIQQLQAGIELIQKAGTKLLEKNGVREMDTTNLFDPELHEALAYVAHPGGTAGTIVEVFEKGYLLDDQLLRPARVAVAQAGESA